MSGERFGGGDGQHRPEPEGHRRGIPHLGADGADRVGQALAAPVGGAGDAVPPGRGPIAVGRFPARRRRHLAILERRAVPVAIAVDRRQHLGREAAGFLEDRFDEIIAEVVEPFGLGLCEARGVAKREKHVGRGSLVGHRSPSPRAAAASSLEAATGAAASGAETRTVSNQM